MFRRGPMPPLLRSFVRVLFISVFAMMLLPVCVGVPIWGAKTLLMLNEFAPTEEDQRLAEDLQHRADDAGVEVEITPQHIAQARRHGQTDEVVEVVDRMVEVRGKPGSGQTYEAPPRPRYRGAYYRDQVAEPEQASGLPWMEIGLAFVGLFLFVAACGAAVMSLMAVGSSDDEPPEATVS